MLSSLPDDELIAELTVIPGIGPWTVQGAMIIALHREDVVLPGDLALRKAIRAGYQLDHLPAQQEVLAIADKWRPYRSLATSYLFAAAFEAACLVTDRAAPMPIADYRALGRPHVFPPSENQTPVGRIRAHHFPGGGIGTFSNLALRVMMVSMRQAGVPSRILMPTARKI